MVVDGKPLASQLALKCSFFLRRVPNTLMCVCLFIEVALDKASIII